MKTTLFRFYNPVKIISGDKALDNLGYELGQLGAKRPLILTDRGVLQAGLIEIVKKLLEGSGNMDMAFYDQVPPDSSPGVVDEAAGAFVKNKCDSIVSVGGGSVIDSGKAVNIVVTEGADSLAKLVGVKLRKPLKPFIVIPTTAGTGSEVTYAAMIRDAEKNKKLLFASYLLFPNVAILDPRMTLTLPPLVTAATAVDALTHAIEACICKPKNPISDAHAIMAIQLIRDNLPKVLENGDDRPGRFCLANAACMAGAAFSNSGVGVIHSLGHALGGVCHVPHGVAMNIFLTHGIEFNMPAVRDIIGELLLPLAGPEVFVQTPPEERPAQTVNEIRRLQNKLHELTGLPRTLKEAGVQAESLEEIAQKAVKDASLPFNPVSVSYEDALELLKRAYQ